MSDVTGFSERLRLALNGQSVNSFANKASLGGSLLRSYLAGTYPSIEKAAIIAKHLDVNLNWLITGEGQMRESAASKRLREIYTAIDSLEVPISAEKLAEDKGLTAIRGELEILARSHEINDTERAGADMALKLAFGDPGGKARAEERFKAVAAELRRAKAMYADAVRLAEWEPPRAFAERLKAAILTYNMSLQDTVGLIDALRADWLVEKNKI